LQQTQEDAQAQIEAMSKIHSLELTSVEESRVNSAQLQSKEHAQTLSDLQAKITSIDEDRERLRQELVDAKQELRKPVPPSPRAGAVTDVDVSALHVAHQAKLSEVEKVYSDKIAELSEVSLHYHRQLSREMNSVSSCRL